MKPLRQSGRAPRPPVIVTFDREGDVLDVVGDLDWFTGEDDDRSGVLARLQDLRSGAGSSGRIPAVELSAGRYADVQVLEEDENCHFVLRDASEVMQVLQRKQQASHELELQERKQRKALTQGPVRPRAQGLEPYRRDAELFARLAEEMRAPLALLNGHVHLLEKRLQADAAGLRSLAAIQHAGTLLEAMANNALLGFGHPEGGARGVLALSQLAALLQQGFGLQASAQGVDLHLRLPPGQVQVDVDDLALRQLLTNLLIHALEGLQGGVLTVAFTAKARALEIDIGHEPEGFTAARFGALLTSTRLLGQGEPGGSYALAVSQQLLRCLHAEVELVERHDGGHDLWMCVPAARMAASEERLPLPEAAPHAAGAAHPGRVAAVAVQGGRAAEILALLGDMGVPALAVDSVARIEALRREEALSLVAMAAGFDARALALALNLGRNGVPVLLLDEAADEAEGWRREGRVVRASAHLHRDLLQAALANLLAAA